MSARTIVCVAVAAWIFAGTLAFGQAMPAQATPVQTNPAPQRPPDVRDRARAALARDPRALPIAAEGRWSKWGPKDPIPGELQPELAAAMRAYGAQDYGASLAFLYAVLEREPDFPAALYQAGLCYFRLRRYGDCAALFERFVRAAPQEIGATQALGHCYYSLGDFAHAREHYEKVLAASPSSPEALRGLALCEWRLGNSERAIQLLSKVLELRPDHAEAHAWLAQIQFDAGDDASALAHAERARDLEPWEPRAWFLLARIYAELDRDADAGEARERFETASRRAQLVLQQEGLLLHDPSRTDVWMELIALHRAGGNRAAVREALPHLAGLAPLLPQVAVFVADHYEWLGDSERASEAARKAESVAGSDKPAWLWLAEHYRRSGDKAGAQRAQAALQSLH